MNKIIACILSFGIMLVVVLGVFPSGAMALEHHPAQIEQLTAVATLAQVQQPPKEPRQTGQIEQPRKKPLQTDRGMRTVSACSICFTCGGSWPIYSGTIGLLEPAASYAPTERGEACSGSLSYADDTHPYLCCRAQ